MVMIYFQVLILNVLFLTGFLYDVMTLHNVWTFT